MNTATAKRKLRAQGVTIGALRKQLKALDRQIALAEALSRTGRPRAPYHAADKICKQIRILGGNP